MEIVARRADRVNFTRALGLAVELQGAAMVSLLLASGVRCDFEESDRPRPPHPLYYDICTLGEAPRLQVDDFAPPLVRAVRLGNVELVRLLLPGGADANVGYHGLLGRCGRQQQQQYGQDREMSMGGPRFSCRRVVQLAMELGYEDIVRLLIVNRGADVWRPHPIWNLPGHARPLVSRSVYLEVTAGLEAEAVDAASTGTKVMRVAWEG